MTVCCFSEVRKNRLLKDVAELLGSQTIDILNSSRSYGRNRSDTSNYQKTGRKLLDESEIFRMPGEKCILTIRGANPWYSDKYDITTHPNYKYLADYNDRNYFDIKKYIARYRSNADFKIGKKIKLQKLKQLKIRHWRIKDLGGQKWTFLYKQLK